MSENPKRDGRGAPEQKRRRPDFNFPLNEHLKPGNENEKAINWEPLLVLVGTILLAYFVAIPIFRWLFGLVF